jgi:hypothetical protein
MVNNLVDDIDGVIVSEKDANHMMLHEIYTGFNRNTLPYEYETNEVEDQGYGIQD